MATEELGLRITADGVYEASSGLKLTQEEIRGVSKALDEATRSGGAFAESQRRVGTEARKAADDVKEAGKAASDAAKAADQAERRWSLFAKTVGGVVGGLIGGAVASNIAKFFSELNRADDLQRLSERTKIVVEDLSVLGYQAKLADTDVNQLARGLQNFNRVLFDAQKGRGENAKLFAQLGIDPSSITDQTQALDVLRDRLSRISDEQTQAAVASRLLGRAVGAELLPFLTQSSTEFAKSRAEGERWAQISGRTAREAALLKDQVVTLGFASGELARTIQALVVPRLNDMLKAFLEARAAGEAYIDSAKRAAGVFLFGNDAQQAESALDKQVERTQKARKAYADVLALNERRPQPEAFVESRRKFLEDQERSLQQAYGRFAELRDKANVKPVEAPRGPEISIDPSTLRDGPKGRTDRTGDRIEELVASLRDQAARASDEIEDSPEIKRYFDVIQRITTGDLRGAGVGQKQAIAQAATERFSAERERRALDEASKAALKQAERREAFEREEERRAEREFAAEEKRREQERLELVREVERETNERRREAARVLEQTRTPLERYNNELERLQSLLDEEFIDWDTFNRGVKRAAEEMEKAEKKADDLGRTIEQAIANSTSRSGELLVDWAFGAKTTVSDVVRSILRDIARVQFQQAAIKPLNEAFNPLVGAAIRGIVGAFTGSSSGVGAGSLGDNAQVDVQHEGGVIGSDRRQSRMVRLPLFHRGGISNDEQLAVLKRGEGVFTPAQMRALSPGGMGDVSVTVNVASDGKSDVQSSGGAAGMGDRIGTAVRAIVLEEFVKQRRPGGLLTA